MIGRELHFNPIFRQLKRAEHHTCIISVEQKRIHQGLVQCKEESTKIGEYTYKLEITLTKAKQTSYISKKIKHNKR
jgi:hypothetical protein